MNKLYPYRKSLAWALLMLVLFLLPGESFEKSPSFPGISEIIHVLMFTFFTLLLLLDMHGAGSGFLPDPGRIGRLKPVFIYKSFLAGIVFGVLIEFLQHIMNLGRTAELKDLVYDLCGILTGLFFVLIYRKLRTPGLPKD